MGLHRHWNGEMPKLSLRRHHEVAATRHPCTGIGSGCTTTSGQLYRLSNDSCGHISEGWNRPQAFGGDMLQLSEGTF